MDETKITQHKHGVANHMGLPITAGAALRPTTSVLLHPTSEERSICTGIGKLWREMDQTMTNGP